eukprot:g15950.t1
MGATAAAATAATAAKAVAKAKAGSSYDNDEDGEVVKRFPASQLGAHMADKITQYGEAVPTPKTTAGKGEEGSKAPPPFLITLFKAGAIRKQTLPTKANYCTAALAATVVTMKTSHRWPGLLGAAVIVLSAGSMAYTDSATTTSAGCIPRFCDEQNNVADCDFDGGDCCSCTCEDTPDYACGDGPGFQCIDPAAPCVDDDDITIDQAENCGFLSGVGDGFCDTDNNNALCGFDGGDCCSCTCAQRFSTSDNPYYDDGGNFFGCDSGSFLCIDPDAACVDDDDITVDQVENCSFVAGIANGFCNEENNNEICAYDGGDCCECTCEGNCGSFACIDPTAPCVDDDDVTVNIDETCNTVNMSDALCDQENNRPECNYDGGDCCSCTCEDTPSTACGEFGGFSCIDPAALCVDDDDITVDQVENCDAERIGDGFCNLENNNEACNYDGGDCCQCTCESTGSYDDDDAPCGRFAGFACVDPMAPCVDDDSVTVDMFDICRVQEIGNGFCDPMNNIEECVFDGGDCCSCTCDSPFGCQSFACVDPSAPCVDDDDITAYMIDDCPSTLSIGNGFCDEVNNIPECNYDGGDCCSCTCSVPEGSDDDSSGPFSACSGFACIDPEAPCVDDDSITAGFLENCADVTDVGNGFCDFGNNNELCNFDGGDCCECTCETQFDDDFGCGNNAFGDFDCRDPNAECFIEEPTDDVTFTDDDADDGGSISFSFDFAEEEEKEEEEPLPTVDGAVDVSTKTDVGVEATAHDVRSGGSGFDVGCGEPGGSGCAAENTLDGVVTDVESRWSCSPMLTSPEAPCQITYTFAEPQDIADVQIAFWKGNERIRTVAVFLDGVQTLTHESYLTAGFNSIGVQASHVSTVMIESVGLLPNEWLSLLEGAEHELANATVENGGVLVTGDAGGS